MADNKEGYETAPRGNECKVTASAYAAAPGPKQAELSHHSPSKLGGENEAEASNAVVGSHHFVHPPSQNENLPPKPESPEINAEKGGGSDVSQFAKGKSDVMDEENVSFKEISADEFHRIPMFVGKDNMLSANGVDFDKGVVFEKEKSISSSAEFLSSHHDETTDKINIVKANEETDDISFVKQIIRGTGTSTTTSSGNNMQNINVICCFDGTNYLQWGQVVRATLMELGKLGHLTDKGPNQTDPDFKVWAKEDSMIISMLRNSIKPEISRNLMFLTTAKAMWENLRQTYSTTKRKDCALFYNLKIQVSLTKQENMSVTDYYNRMSGLWFEIDNNRDLQLKSTHDVDVVRKLLQHDRVYEFLAGLNAEYDQIKVQILGKIPIPSLHEVFFIVRAEESRCHAASAVGFPRPEKGSNMGNPIFHGKESRQRGTSAMVYQTPQKGNNIQQLVEPKKTCGKNVLRCSYCHQPRHTIENCYKMNGKAQVLARSRGVDGEAQSQTNMANKEEIHDEATKLDKEDEHQHVQEKTKHGDDDSQPVDVQVLGKRNLDIAELENGSKRCKSTSSKATSSVPIIVGRTDESQSIPAQWQSTLTTLQTTEDMFKEMKANQLLLMQAFEKVAPGLLKSLNQLTSSSTLPPPPPPI